MDGSGWWHISSSMPVFRHGREEIFQAAQSDCHLSSRRLDQMATTASPTHPVRDLIWVTGLWVGSFVLSGTIYYISPW